jgi:aminoacyl tRNA synthase complex-interacting multifunctional protein 1
MSFQAALSKLPSPVINLVNGATQGGSQDFGKSKKDQAEVVEWIEKAAKGTIVVPSALKVRRFIASHHNVGSTGVL